MKDLDINQVARRTGLPASALRHYEEKGLIASVGRRGLRRLFDPSVIQRLALVAMGRAAGFSLDEMARMFAADGKPRIDKRLLAAKAEEIDATIRHLTSMRDGLRHADPRRAPPRDMSYCSSIPTSARMAGDGCALPCVSSMRR